LKFPKESYTSFDSILIKPSIDYDFKLLLNMEEYDMAGKTTKRDDSSKSKKGIISVTINEGIKDRIDDLVTDRVARSRAQLIEDAVRWYLEFTVHKWNERGIYVNAMRVLLQPEALSSLFFSTLTPSDQNELGETAGSQSPIADVVKIFHNADPHDESNRTLVLKLLEDSGWGSLKFRGTDMIVVGSPFYPAPFMKGYLETLLKVKLELVETNVKETVAFKIK